MIRKIIKQGHNTLTMTLPSNWVKKFNLTPGDEIDLSERDNGLFITTEKHNSIMETDETSKNKLDYNFATEIDIKVRKK